jgi:hypothetical protein
MPRQILITAKEFLRQRVYNILFLCFFNIFLKIYYFLVKTLFYDYDKMFFLKKNILKNAK